MSGEKFSLKFLICTAKQESWRHRFAYLSTFVADMQISQTCAFSVPVAGAQARSSLLLPVLSIAGGLSLLWVVGFAQPEFLHNAAHDSRHSVAFPCH